jgi:hypothetical protein
MSVRSPIYDVFLSHTQADVAWATEIERKFMDAGLSVFRLGGSATGESISDSLWDALAESSSFVALVASAGIQAPSFGFEVGAAMAWRKPVYVLFKGARPSTLPAYVEKYGIFPASQVDRVVRLVSRESIPLPEEQQQLLMQAYEALGVPVDRLQSQPANVEKLTRQFNRASKSNKSGERLLREILRLRKQGGWPRVGHVHA